MSEKMANIVDKNEETNCETKALVSVIMTVFNEQPYMIHESILSILNQTYKNFELLIFDDSTNDDSKKAVDYFSSDKRVKIFREANRIGFVPSLNRGLTIAEGDYIARMDADDISLNNRFELEVEFLSQHSNVGVVGGQLNIINEKGEIISSRKYPCSGMKLFFYSAIRCPLAHPTIMMKKAIADDGFRYDENLKTCEDLDLWLRLMNNGIKLVNIPETVLNYRVTDNFISKRSNRKQLENVALVRNRNFSKRYFFHSVMSCITAWLFLNAPVSLIQGAYKNENRS